MSSLLQSWLLAHLPDLTQKIIVITGANSGLGYSAALEFARKGGHVVMACRDPQRAQQAREQILALVPQASLEIIPLDLTNLASIRAFAQEFRERHQSLHILCNNAGVMAIPYRTTADGFEMQLGTNHLGHFALTGLLLDPILATPGARVVTTTSLMHRMGKMRWDDLHWQRAYSKWPAYGQSKLANLLFTYELQRKFSEAGVDAMAVACHPGYASTNLQLAGPRMSQSTFMEAIFNRLNRWVAQSAAMGALPLLYAATAKDVRGGDVVGPGGMFEMRGFPKRSHISKMAQNPEQAKRLWQISEELTQVHFLLPPATHVNAEVA